MFMSKASLFLPTYWKTFPGIYFRIFDCVYIGTAVANGIFFCESDCVNTVHGKVPVMMTTVSPTAAMISAAVTDADRKSDMSISISISFFIMNTNANTISGIPMNFISFFSFISYFVPLSLSSG